MAGPPTIVVHNLAHARAAFAAAELTGVAIRVISAPGAAAYSGAAWFRELVDIARGAHPLAKVETVLDCGAEAGLALGAIRSGVEAIRITAAPGPRARIAAIAEAAGCRVITDERVSRLDLLDARDPARAAGEWLANRRPRD